MALIIKKIIKEKGLSVQEIAEKMGISRVTLSQHLNGNPTVQILQRIAEAIGVSVKELFDDESGNKLTAFIDYEGEYYKAYTIEELEEIVKKLKFIEKKSAK